jgi:hypothetical protein
VFRAGLLPAALAPVFIHRRDAVPCRAWSWSNQLLTALAGHSDARGFRQWLDVGRAVRKGARAFQILGPLTVKRRERDSESGEERERMALVGFKSIPVFGRDQTDVIDGEKWARASKDGAEAERFIAGLPVVSVARAWGLNVETYNGTTGRALGYYRHGQAIALGVKNLSTWAHELCHAADDRCVGGLKGGQHFDQETVAELGGAVLLTVLGYDAEADIGGVWVYIKGYCEREKKTPIAVCQKLLERICNAVALILDTAEGLKHEIESAPSAA